MEVTINGQSQVLNEKISIAKLLEQREVERSRVAVELNEDVVPRNSFAQTMIGDGDRIEIVTFVGGG